MLILVTGEPGNGKTAYVVNQLAQAQGSRPLWVWGIPELTIPHEVCPPLDEWTVEQRIPEDPKLTRPVFTFSPGSIVVVDEAQVVYRVRSAASKVPAHVAALETHRHQGLDIYLITQKPSLIDSNVRALVGKHIHLRSSWAGRYVLEWGECKDPASSAHVATAVRTRYKLPSKIFNSYKSATEHTKINRRLPPQAAFVGVVLLACVLAFFYARYRMDRLDDPPVKAPSAKAPGAETELAKASPPEPRAGVVHQALPARLVSSVYVRVGSSVIHDYHYADDGEGGKRVRIEGHQCAGAGTDAQCHLNGHLVSYGAGGVPQVKGEVPAAAGGAPVGPGILGQHGPSVARR